MVHVLAIHPNGYDGTHQHGVVCDPPCTTLGVFDFEDFRGKINALDNMNRCITNFYSAAPSDRLAVVLFPPNPEDPDSASTIHTLTTAGAIILERPVGYTHNENSTQFHELARTLDDLCDVPEKFYEENLSEPHPEQAPGNGAFIPLQADNIDILMNRMRATAREYEDD